MLTLELMVLFGAYLKFPPLVLAHYQDSLQSLLSCRPLRTCTVLVAKSAYLFLSLKP